MTDLLPCRWCGEDSRDEKGRPLNRHVFSGGHGSACVKCLMCGATGPAADTEDGAIKRWNARPAPAGAEAVREALLKYGGHRKRCEYHKRPRGRACSCGWDAIVHALPTALATPQPAPTAAADGLREFVESIVNAMGPYPDLNGHPIISAAYAALRAKPEASTEKGE